VPELVTRYRVLGLTYDDRKEAGKAAKAASAGDVKHDVVEEQWGRVYDVVNTTTNALEVVGVEDPDVAAHELARLTAQTKESGGALGWRGPRHEFEVRDRLVLIEEED
jgi:hypothetical protein